ncbi:MAG: serine/threonine protein kinase [Acidobacteria bacterium]|nr:serine/threonine protein kinase [Acidobacteriota bacterium]
MTPERWQQIKILVNSALERSAEDRSATLQQSCAEDVSLRRGAEALLSFHEQATRNLANAPALNAAKLSSAGTMSPERWQQVEQLFQSALELPAAERAAFLAKACGDDRELRQEVEALLVFQTGMSGVIQGAVEQAAGLLDHSSAKARFAAGMTLNKRYRIIGLLGRGGMGEVYRADDLKLGHPVALKFLTEKLSQDKAMLARFHGEVAMAHRVTHPNVCRVHDIGEVTTSSGKLHFLSMEYVDGEDLSSLLRRIGRLPADKAVEIANQLCAGLAAAHEAGVLHRDLKPANVMLDGKGRVRITDFGLAGFAEQIRNEEVFAGTPAYMSPEQFAGKEVTTKSDIYALGLVLYEIFTGKRVFEAGSLAELQQMHESSAPTNPSNWVKDIDPLVERVILRCLEKDPSKRLASAKQVADALPGGDPLAAALAMGETPSPEMVAAAPLEGTLRPAVAVACLAAVLVGLALIVLLAGQKYMTRNGPLEKSPEVLSERASEIASQLGYTAPPVDKAWGFGQDFSYKQYVAEHDATVNRWDKLRMGEPSAIYFWYRQSPRYLLPYNPGPVQPDDPPLLTSGAVDLTLDPRGRLRGFQAVPPQLDEATDAAPAPDYTLLFALAGLDITKFTPTVSKWLPPVNSDHRAAWEGVFPYQAQLPLRIEAASYRGRPVYFQMIAPWDKPSRMGTDQQAVIINPWMILTSLMTLAGVLVAHRNLRLGRGDRKGAFRLALYFFALTMLSYFVASHHTPTGAEFNRYFTNIALASFYATSVWLLYLALEPYVRRRWPHRIIAWSRLLAGHFRDPLVGREFLVGSLFAVGLVLLLFPIGLIRKWLGLLERQPLGVVPQTLHGLRGLAEAFVNAHGSMLIWSLWLLLILLFLSRVLRRKWLLVSATWLLFTFIFGLQFRITNAEGWVFVGLLNVCWITLQMRFGLLATTVFFTNVILLVTFPVTSDFSAWYAEGTFFVLGVFLITSGYGFYTSLGGQKVFAGKLLEE